jgi:hypothetical protein
LRTRYEHVPREELELIRVPRPRSSRNRLAFRRICCAVLAVATAFVTTMLRSLPTVEPVEVFLPQTPRVEKLLSKLVSSRNVQEHIQKCHSVENRDAPSSKWQRLASFWRPTLDCSDGVLHIPARQTFSERRAKRETMLPQNTSWFFPCSQQFLQLSCASNRDTCSSSTVTCFRGIHNDFLDSKEVDDVLTTGKILILNRGGDHFDVHYNVEYLQKRHPEVVMKLALLLRNTYNVLDARPVAYRIHAMAPMDGDILWYKDAGAKHPLFRLLNRSRYSDWIEKSLRKHKLARFSLPWPFGRLPVRSACHLMTDIEADTSFAYHTMAFLSDGAGRHFLGGASLFVDDTDINLHSRFYHKRKRKIQRGLLVEGFRGRVVISSGDQKRCALPTMEGIRVVLQIWWTC